MSPDGPPGDVFEDEVDRGRVPFFKDGEEFASHQERYLREKIGEDLFNAFEKRLEREEAENGNDSTGSPEA